MLPFKDKNDAFGDTETLDIDYFEWKYAGLDFEFYIQTLKITTYILIIKII